MDILILLGKQKRVFLSIWIFGSLLALMIVLNLPRYYSASTVILPPQQQQSSAAGALASLGALAGVAGGAMGVKAPDEIYLTFLKTQRLQTALIQKLDLKKRYGLASMEETRARLTSLVQVSSDKKTGLITVTADDRDALFAAKLANAHFEELHALLSVIAVSDAQQRRVFFEQQVLKSQQSLKSAEISFREEQEKNGFVAVQAMAESGARSQIELQSKIAAREVQLSVVNKFMTPQSSESQKIKAEILAMQQQLELLQKGKGSSEMTSDVGQRNAMQAFRAMKVQEASLEFLVRQLEVAKIDEAKEGPLLQQIDVAIPSEFPSKPKRIYLIVAPSVLFFLLGTIIAYVRALHFHQKSESKDVDGFRQLKQAWF